MFVNKKTNCLGRYPTITGAIALLLCLFERLNIIRGFVMNNNNNRKDNKRIYCLSGGAVGSDWLFGLVGKELGYTTLAYSFKGHKVCEGSVRIELDDKSLYEYMENYRRIAGFMGRTVAIREYSKKLILRDFFQIYGRFGLMSELVICVGEIEGRTVNIKGGSGYAVRVAMSEKIPIILIDKSENYSYKWFNYSNGSWRSLIEGDINNFKIKYGFTGIGSRDIDISKARNSIIRLLNKVL